MKKKVIAIVLTAIMISSVCAFPASAMNGSTTVEGKTFSYVLNWNTSYNGAYSSSSYGASAYYMYAYVKYYYTKDGKSDSVYSQKTLNNVQSAAANVSVSGSTKGHAESVHTIRKTSASNPTSKALALY